MALFPVVPNVPGVPPVARLPGASPIPTAVLLVGDVAGIVNSFLGPQWGIFTQPAFGLPRTQVVGQGISNIISAVTGLGTNNFLDLDFRSSYSISEYSVEAGGFQSYNKVQRPYDVACTVTAGGTVTNREALLAQVEGIISSIDLFSVQMPERPLGNVNPVNYGYSRRSDRGLGLLMVTIMFKQVRPAGDPQFSTTSTTGTAAASSTSTAPDISNPVPAAASATTRVPTGVVSPQAASPAIVSAVRG